MITAREMLVLLKQAAELEHQLMVQYLFAAYSLKTEPEEFTKSPDPNASARRNGRWRRTILNIAREEMGHLITVQQVILSLGGRPHFERDSFPITSRFYPFPFSLERLTRQSLARYLWTEKPREDEKQTRDELLGSFRSEIEQDVYPHPPNELGKLYEAILTGLEQLKDHDFRGDVENQTDVQSWPGLGKMGIVERIKDQKLAIHAIKSIVEQGEGHLHSEGHSHFQQFLEIYREFPGDGEEPSRDIATNPNTAVPNEKGHDIKRRRELKEGQITWRETFLWAKLFNKRYAVLLTELTHALMLTDLSHEHDKPPKATVSVKPKVPEDKTPATCVGANLDHIEALTSEQIKALNIVQINALTADEIAALSANQFQVLSAKWIGELTPKQFAALTADQIATLTDDQILNLTTDQFAALTADQIASLTKHQIPKLSTDQIVALTTDQIKALTERQINELKEDQIKALMPHQIEAMLIPQLETLRREHGEVLTKFRDQDKVSRHALRNRQLREVLIRWARDEMTLVIAPIAKRLTLLKVNDSPKSKLAGAPFELDGSGPTLSNDEVAQWCAHQRMIDETRQFLVAFDEINVEDPDGIISAIAAIDAGRADYTAEQLTIVKRETATEATNIANRLQPEDESIQAEGQEPPIKTPESEERP